MTEAEWLASTDPQAMLAYLQGYWTDATGRHRHDPPALSLATERKLRLFACACRELCTCSLKEEWDAKSWAVFANVDNCPCTHAVRAALLRCIFGNPWRPVPGLQCAKYQGGVWHETADWLTPVVIDIARAIYDDRRWDELFVLADALEEAGCPSEAKCRCAEGRYAHSHSKSDAGATCVCEFCEGFGFVPNPLLTHLRGPGPHARGCWALDLILGKE